MFLTWGELLIGGGGVGRSRPRAHAARVSWSAEPSHADLGCARDTKSPAIRRRHVRAVALEGDVGSTLGLRFEFLRFRAGGRDGRGSRTKTLALPPSLTVMSAPVADLTCA